MNEQTINDTNNEIPPDKPALVFDANYQEVVALDEKTKNRFRRFSTFSFMLSIITITLCTLGSMSVALMALSSLLGGSIGIAFLTAFLFIVLQYAYIPLIVLIALSTAMSLIVFIVSTRKTSKLDDYLKANITKRSLISAILLFAPAIIYPIAHLFHLYLPPLSNTEFSFFEFCLPAVFVVNLVAFIILRARKNQIENAYSKAAIRTSIIIIFAIELILCIGWSLGVVCHEYDKVKSTQVENEKQEQALRNLRNPAVDDELSDIMAMRCELKPYEIIYSDNKKEAIFGCSSSDASNKIIDINYAAYHGKDENGKKEASLIEFGRLYNNNHFMKTDIIGETRHPYQIAFVEAKDEASAYEEAKAFIAKSLSFFSSTTRAYVFYADGYSTVTTKDYLNAILSSNIYLKENNTGRCNYDFNIYWNIDEKQYKCVEAKGDLFQRYLNNQEHYSTYSTSALFESRHIYVAPLKSSFNKSRTTESDFALLWRKPFTQGRLTFKYLPSETFEKHDGNLDWEDEDSRP